MNEQMVDLTGAGYSATSADWSIVQGVALNGVPTSNKVKTICSGTSTSSHKRLRRAVSHTASIPSTPSWSRELRVRFLRQAPIG